MALRGILQRHAILVAFGVEADIRAQAEFDDLVENDPKQPKSISSLIHSAYYVDNKCGPMLVSYMANLDHVFHSLSDATRRAVIAQLASGPASISDLAQRHHMALPSFMKHIRVLEESEIVTSRKKGRVRMCELRPRALTVAQGWLEQERRKWEARLDRLDGFIETLAAKEKTNGKKR